MWTVHRAAVDAFVLLAVSRPDDDRLPREGVAISVTTAKAISGGSLGAENTKVLAGQQAEGDEDDGIHCSQVSLRYIYRSSI